MGRNAAAIRKQVVNATMRMPLLEWNWSEGVAMYGLVTLWKRQEDDSILRFVGDWINDQLDNGQVFENVNATAPCFALLELYDRAQDERYGQIIRSRISFLMKHALRLRNGAFEHTLAETKFGGQMWVDTLFMAGLFLVKAGLLLQLPEVLEEGIRQYQIHVQMLQQDNGLFYHAWDEASGQVKGCQWARGNAWATMVSVELADMLPDDHPARPFIAETLKQQLAGLKETQDVSGLWNTVLTEPGTYLETSAGAGIAYAVLKGIRLGCIDPAYSSMGEAAMRAALAFVDWSGVFKGVSAGTGVQNHPGEYHVIAQDRIEGYGQGILLMMLSEDIPPLA
ncbi:MAG: hypothetical protein K0R57_998 [Paenibacillaceae bacterium]|jgi:unsaturated rhamnogalacturonyl hydrolase|nr:hypothetical protein [Paenibacillaceae bacterium]